MKKLLLALAACCFLFACDKNEKQPEEPAEAPELTLTSESVVNVPADGDEVTITYTLANPAENGDISAKAADGGDWCDGFNCDTDGQVTFTVAANEGDARETVVTVTYTYGESEHKDITVTVKQVALGDPLFELTSESEVSVSKDGGDVTVTYSITDPREDGAVSVNVPEGVDWISNVNTDTDGQVTFTVAANDGDAREAELTFVYTYGGSETQEFTVKVSQEGAPAPVLNITSETEVRITRGAGNFTITYEIEGSREDGEISASANGAEWITTNAVVDGRISVEVAENEGDAERTAAIAVTYTYSGDKTVSATVNLTQSQYDYEFDLPILTGGYYGDDYSVNDGEMLYQLHLTNNEELWQYGGAYYWISILSGEPSDMDAIAPAVGTYTMSPTASSDIAGMNTVVKSTEYTVGYVYPEASVGGMYYSAFFSWGELELTYENGEYHLDAVLTDTRNKTHHLTYTGPIVCENYAQPDQPDDPEPNPDAISLLTEDLTINWTSAMLASAYYWGSGRYTFELRNSDTYSSDPKLMMELYIEGTEQVVPTGTFEINNTKEANTVLVGSLSESMFGGATLAGSWVYPATGSAYSGNAAPLTTGTVTITDNGNGSYTMVVDAEDDANNAIKVTAPFSATANSFINLDY